MYNSNKSKPYPIKETVAPKEEVNNYLKRNSISFERRLDINAFDPSKNSPPNPWLAKLENRIQNYYKTN